MGLGTILKAKHLILVADDPSKKEAIPKLMSHQKDMARYAGWLNLFLNAITEQIHPSLILLGGGLMNAKMMRGLIALPEGHYRFAQPGNRAGIVGAQALPIPE